MMIVRTFAAFAVFAGALCKPIAGACQTAVSLAEVQPATVSSAAPVIDTAKRLEGRLFFSVPERQRLDQARKRGLVVNDEGVFIEAPPNVLNGFVKRSDGKAVIWVDGEVRWNAQSPNATNLVPANVGAPAEYVKPMNVEAPKPAQTRKVRAKKTPKARPKPPNLPRLLP